MAHPCGGESVTASWLQYASVVMASENRDNDPVTSVSLHLIKAANKTVYEAEWLKVDII